MDVVVREVAVTFVGAVGGCVSGQAAVEAVTAARDGAVSGCVDGVHLERVRGAALKARHRRAGLRDGRERSPVPVHAVARDSDVVGRGRPGQRDARHVAAATARLPGCDGDVVSGGGGRSGHSSVRAGASASAELLPAASTAWTASE